MKLYEALFKAQTDTKNLLVSSGLLDGITLSQSEVKTTQSVLFWHLEVKSEEASRKSTYVTYSITNIKPIVYGDGKCITQNVEVNIIVFTNKEDISVLVSEINNQAESKDWTFDLAAPISFEQQSKLYTYSFILSKVYSNE